jgi:hypothetical protein
VQITDIFALSADVQYLRDAIARIGPGHRDPEGWIFGLRATAAF